MFTVSDQDNYNEWVRANSNDPYGKGIISFAERWASLMEEELGENFSKEKFAKIAEKTSDEADTEGITGFMYGCAINMLATTWIHGEQLRKWHNKEYGNENSTGVINPALLRIEL